MSDPAETIENPTAEAAPQARAGQALEARREAAPDVADARRRRSRKALRKLLLIVVPAIAVAGGVYFYLQGGRFVGTDNAYVAAQKVIITPEVSGKVVSIAVQEGQAVKVGDPLLKIDPSTYQIAQQAAEAQVAKVRTEFNTLKATLGSVNRQLDLAQQTLTLRQADLSRKTELLNTRSGSRAEVDTAEIAVTAARGQLEQLQQQKATITSQLQGNPDLPLEAFPPYREAQAALERARHDLERTVLRAPISGVATQVSSIQMGRFLDSGNAIFSIIAQDHPWVEANPKETDLTWLKPGQPVSITVDAYPSRVWHGHVGSISPGTGAQFAILPPQNASGNWVKVVQRVPIRIEFDGGENTQELRAGMSTNVEIDTGRQRTLASLFGFGSAVAGSTQVSSK
jgi:membrane fusion protein (multidrug efflux system)